MQNCLVDKIYDLKPCEILDKLYNNKANGFSLDEIEKKEAELGYKLPRQLRNYYENYGKLGINYCLHPIYKIDEIVFSYELLDDEDIGEEEKNNTQNYLMFWNENQGVWNAGVLEEDLQKGLDNPKVYMTTEDDLITWEVVSDSLESFLLSMIIENSEEGFSEMFSAINRPIGDWVIREIKKENVMESIEKYNIDIDKLKSSYSKHIVTCWDEINKKLFVFFLEEGQFVLLWLYEIA